MKKHIVEKAVFRGKVSVRKGKLGKFVGRRTEKCNNWNTAQITAFYERDTAELEGLLESALRNQSGEYAVEMRLVRIEE